MQLTDGAPSPRPIDPPGLNLPPAAVSQLLTALQAVRDGDFSVRLPGDWTGLEGKIADTFNEIVAANAADGRASWSASARWSGKQGKTRQRVHVRPRRAAPGARWRRSVNTLIDDLLWPTTEVTRAIAAVAKGDLLQTVRLDVDGRPLEGEFLRSATIVNTMIEQLGVFTSEVTRVAREVGTDGKLGGQAQVPRRQRRVEGPHRQRQLDGQQPDRAGAQHLRGDHRAWPAATCRARSRSTCAARSCSSRKPSTRWSTSCARSPRR